VCPASTLLTSQFPTHPPYALGQEREVKEAARADHTARRRENIGRKRDTQLSFPLLEHDSSICDMRGAADRIFPRKGKVPGREGTSNSVDDYEMRPGRATTSAFRSNQERVLCDAPTGRAARRLQSLINCDSGGRAYDIISNHRKPLRPTIGEAHATRMMHPSNLSLPRGAGTAPTLVGPVPDAHKVEWKPPSPTRSPSKMYLK